MHTDVVVVGAGAAGMMCAAEAARRARRVLLIDHRGTIGERIRISGGGRCNVTNLGASPAQYISRNPHFCRSALARYTPADMLALLDEHQVPWEEREAGQVFCQRSAHDVVGLLRARCDRAGVTWLAPCEVGAVTRRGDALGPSTDAPARFVVATSAGDVTCEALVVASGGLAAPQLGASSFGYDIATQFGIAVVEPRPALVPLVLAEADWAAFSGLAGVAFACRVQCPPSTGQAFTGRVLITHGGLSGPAILQVSSYWQTLARDSGSRPALSLNLLPDADASAWLDDARARGLSLTSALSHWLPRRLVESLVRHSGWPDALPHLTAGERGALAQALNDWHVHPIDTLGFRKAEVTAGGVDTRALSSKTMEARTCPGLYFIGEVVDVTGWLGGYNFQWAWSSGWVAGQYA